MLQEAQLCQEGGKEEDFTTIQHFPNELSTRGSARPAPVLWPSKASRQLASRQLKSIPG